MPKRKKTRTVKQVAQIPEPVDYRGQHADRLRDGTSAIERSDKQILDSQGKGGAPSRVHDTLSVLRRNETISDIQVIAGERYGHDFHTGMRSSLRIIDLTKPLVRGNPDPHEAAAMRCDARAAWWAATIALGGLNSPLSHVCDSVLGEGKSLAEYAREGPGFMRPETASALLVGALTVLTMHYGLQPRD